MIKKKTYLLLTTLMLFSACSSTNGSSKTKHHLVKVDEVPATCIEDGVKEYYTCSDSQCANLCFDSEGNEIRRSSLVITALGHDYQVDNELRYLASIATCETEAKYYKACSRCGKKGTETFYSGETLPHTYGEVVVEPTVGGQVETHKNNTFSIEYTAYKSCQNCPHMVSETKTGQLVIKEGEDATCTKDGKGQIVVEFSNDFGGAYTQNVTIDKTGHDINGVAYSSDENSHWKQCKNCSEKIDVSAHSYQSQHDENNHWKECAGCNKIIEKSAHNFADRVVTLLDLETGLVKATLTCQDEECRYEKYEEQTASITIISNATCTAPGSATVNATFSEEFGGTYTDTVVITPEGHVSDNVLDHDANTHFYHCTKCGEKVNIEQHEASEYTVDCYPTDTELGQRSGVCSKCDETFVQSFAQCQSGQHKGVHYKGLEPTKLEAGYAGFYYCESCHKVILDNEHVENDGTWVECADSVDVTPSHKAYLEPTVNADDIITMLDNLSSSLNIASSVSLLDKLALEKVDSYLDVYLTKDGAKEEDITNMDIYRGINNALKYSTFNDYASISTVNEETKTSNTWSYASNVQRDLLDSDNDLKYAKFTVKNDFAKWQAAAYFDKNLFMNATTDILFYIKPSISTSFHYYINGKRSTNPIEAVADKWTPIIIPYSYSKALQEAETPGDCYLSNNDDYKAGYTYAISDLYLVSGLNLPSYKLYSNEGYATGSTFAGLTCNLSTNLHSYAMFNNTAEPTAHPDYRNYFLETKISNKSGADKTYSDLCVSNAYYGGLYFGTGSYTFNETVTEMFFMIYANEEVDIQYTNFTDIVRKGSEKNTATVEKTIYKGWNLIHIANIDATNGTAIKANGHFFQIVPTVWTTTLELTMSAMFYKTLAN